MITQQNLAELLAYLGFTEEDSRWQKSFGKSQLTVDFSKKRIFYPSGIKVHSDNTCNFSQNENFVVLECVHRLLEKGYKAKHLELEPKWKLGHGLSGGRADILVKDQQNKPLLIIECKTYGGEFKKEWEKMQKNGGQLFTYVQQTQSIRFLCLYATDFVNQEIIKLQRIISHQDNEKILSRNRQLRSFSDADEVVERFAVWRDTYQLEYTENGIFEDTVQSYKIGKSKYTVVADTHPVSVADTKGKYNEFRTILRKYNVARRENAFEVLVNLFLCKIVDEESNPTDLKFYWKGIAYDNYFDFVDRLQDLYQQGMGQFLNEKISYISNKQINDAFWAVKNNRNATEQQIESYFHQLKFFTNSAFSFIDTYNEKLFNKNVRILVEVVRLWQGSRLKSDDPNQFLGDMFEYFLDNGIKQSNGQFFTPLPICKFIVASLPLMEKTQSGEKPQRVIDYACGAGHFLTEYAHQIAKLIKNKKKLQAHYQKIVGVEKEDRLAKVAKVAAYMHGQEQIKILDADALAKHESMLPNQFDVLIANPPFSVEGFLQTLDDEDKNRYELVKACGKTSETDDIECFFLERIHHLMAPGGVVGVIVPSGILSNADAMHTQTREIILQFFEVISIVELGGKTFGKTGTKTVVLFLRRRMKMPQEAKHYANRVADFFDVDTVANGKNYKDDGLLKAYCKHIEIPLAEYKKLFGATNIKQLNALLKYDIFQDYQRDFERKDTRNQSQNEIHKGSMLITHMQKIEKSKLLYFILATQQTNEVLIVNAPTGNIEQKQFLGYEWGSRKGSEGIKYNGGEIVDDIITPMFNPNDLNDDAKINTAIKNNFIGKKYPSLPKYCRLARLVDMLDFSRVEFDKKINLNPQHNIALQSRWEQKKLVDIVDTIESGNRPKGGVGKITSGAWSLGGAHIHADNGRVELTTPKYIPLEFYNRNTKGRLQKNDILLCKDGALTGKIALLQNELNNEKAMVNEHVFILRFPSLTQQKYVFNFLLSEIGQGLLKGNITGSAQGGLNLTNLKQIKIPLPLLKVQEKIITECAAIDFSVGKAQQLLETAKQKIAKKVQAVTNAGYEMKKLGEVAEVRKGKSIIQKLTNPGSIKVVAGGVSHAYLHNETNRPAKTITISASGANAGYVNYWHEPIFASDCTTVQSNDRLINYYLFQILKSSQNNISSLARGAAQPHVYPGDIANLTVPVPSLSIQQKLVNEVGKLELQITKAQTVIDQAVAEKNKIMKKHL